MCPCDKESGYVCMPCRNQIARMLRTGWDRETVRRYYGEWKCELVA